MGASISGAGTVVRLDDVEIDRHSDCCQYCTNLLQDFFLLSITPFFDSFYILIDAARLCHPTHLYFPLISIQFIRSSCSLDVVRAIVS